MGKEDKVLLEKMGIWVIEQILPVSIKLLIITKNILKFDLVSTDLSDDCSIDIGVDWNFLKYCLS